MLTAVPPLPVVALFGPTGIGKTEVALALADRLRADGEDPVAVSADALQLYAGLEILTGAPSAAQRARLEHRLVGVLPLTERATAGEYARRAHAEIDALLAAGRRPLVVGGTGLYLRAALADLDLRPPPDPAVRAALAARVRPARARRRSTRSCGVPIRARRRPSPRPTRSAWCERSSWPTRGERAPGGDQLWTRATRHPTLLAALVMDRAELYARIDARVAAMVAAGAADEVRRAVAAGASPSARQALGFEELLRGDVEAMRVRTRRYAKRQLTWLRKLPGALVVDVTGRAPAAVAAELRAALGPR